MQIRTLLLAAAATAALSAAGAAQAATPLVIAGGGGGSSYSDTNGGDGQVTLNGANGYGAFGGAGGVAGSGGAGGANVDGGNGGGGGGWAGDGAAGLGTAPIPDSCCTAGQGGSGPSSFAGGAGGEQDGQTADGGFGGGGGGGWQGGGGGGGYSGGGGGDGDGFGGGGGGSYVDPGLNLINAVAGANGVDDSSNGSGVGNNGYVTINGVTFNFTGAVQDYVIPTTGLYDITAVGAQGGGSDSAIGGFGALIQASGNFTAGTDLAIVVGGAGNYGDFGGTWAGGGGGGTFVALNSVGSSVPGVPEPATWAMMLLGMGGVGALMRRSRRQAGKALAAA